MSSQQVFDILWREAIYAQFTVSAVALYILDYFYILPREVALVWKNQIGFGGVLYLMTRFTLGISTTRHVSTLEVSIPAGMKADETLTSAQLSMFIIVAAILIIRVYAISNQNRYVLAALASLAIGSVIPAFMEMAALTCNASIVKTTNTQNMVLFDIILIVVILYHTLGLRRLQVGTRSDKMSLTSLLIQQASRAQGQTCIGLIRFLFSLSVTVTLILPNQVLPVSQAFVNCYKLTWRLLFQPGLYNLLLYHGQIIQIGSLSRFFLDLRWLSAHPNGTTFTKAMTQRSSQSQLHGVLSLTTFRATARSQWTPDLELEHGGCEPVPGRN
ncbi:hypothetical protein K439DRAFT_1612105 [Ramaria rubella]|nr:hypothetical protein K439DRAFT_1612105 [Ramaria rubella]